MTDLVDAALRQRTVLLVDDDSEMQSLVEEQLELAGLDVVCTSAAGLDEGLALARELHPDLVVLDHHFEGDDRTGSDAVGRFKEAGAGMVLVFTVSTDVTEYEIRGADAVLDKMSLPLLPVTVGLLLADDVTVDLRD